MVTVCGGWRGVDGRKVHEGERVLVPEDGKDTRVSHGICMECKEAFLERLNQLHEERSKT
jgi:hypothetical protein